MIDGAGARIWAEEIGDPDAVPVLLVHRMAAQGFEWPDELLDGLLVAGYRVIVYDHRGFGWSESGPLDPPMSFQNLVDDAKAVLAAFGADSAHLVGSSVGGVIARCVALECHDVARSLTFLGSSPGDGSLPVWSPEYTEVALSPPGPSVDERVDYLVRELRVMSDDRFDEAAALLRAQRCVRRGWTLDSLRRVARAAKQRSLYELTDAISSKDRVRALEVLDAILSSGDGEEAAIGHIYMLAKTFRQMLVILERNVRDQRMLWAALWQGFRVPPFAADDIIKQARRYKSRRDLTRAIRLVAKADLALRSNPVSKRMVLERLVMDLTTEPKLESPGWMQEQLPV